MRVWFCVLLLCASAIGQESNSGPDFSRGARERGSFYLNGIGHQYLQGKNYTVVAAAIPVLNSKYFGVKVHVFNRGTSSVNVLPESVTVEDSVSARRLELFSAADVADRLRRQPAWVHVAGMVAGEPAARRAGERPLRQRRRSDDGRLAARTDERFGQQWNDGLRGSVVSGADRTRSAEA